MRAKLSILFSIASLIFFLPSIANAAANTIINNTINGYLNQNVTITNGQTLTLNITTNNTDSANITLYLNGSLVQSLITASGIMNYTNSTIGAGLWNLTSVSNATANFNSNSTQFIVNIISYGPILNTSYKIGQNITLNTSMNGFVSFIDNMSLASNTTNNGSDVVYTNILNYTLPQVQLFQYSGVNATWAITVLNTTANQNITITKWYNQPTSIWSKDNVSYGAYFVQNINQNSTNWYCAGGGCSWGSDNHINTALTGASSPLSSLSQGLSYNFKLEVWENQSTSSHALEGLINLNNSRCSTGTAPVPNGYCTDTQVNGPSNFYLINGGSETTSLISNSGFFNTGYPPQNITIVKNSTGWTYYYNNTNIGSANDNTYFDLSFFVVQGTIGGSGNFYNISLIRMGDRSEIYSYGPLVGLSGNNTISFSQNSSTSPVIYSNATTNFTIDANNQTNPIGIGLIQLNYTGSLVNYTMLINSTNATDTIFIFNKSLSAGVTSYQFFINDSANIQNSTILLTLSISKGTSTMTITGTNVTSTDVGTVKANEFNFGDADVNYTLWRNTTLVASGNSTSGNLTDANVLAAGTYSYVYNSTGGANWTSNSTGVTLLIVISQARAATGSAGSSAAPSNYCSTNTDCSSGLVCISNVCTTPPLNQTNTPPPNCDSFCQFGTNVNNAFNSAITAIGTGAGATVKFFSGLFAFNLDLSGNNGLTVIGLFIAGGIILLIAPSPKQGAKQGRGIG